MKKEKFEAKNGYSIEFTPDVSGCIVYRDGAGNLGAPMNPGDAATPEFLEAWEEVRQKVRGRPRKAEPKVNATLRLDAQMLAAIKAGGPGYNVRIENVLRQALEEGRL